ncbi:hypothetical protein BJ165DRAFT_1430417 [Panaeolus papilionaceus]|nr:hypothetical protein BJ165DRAFT_1430417 [Panaeolus papilionaceus]
MSTFRASPWVPYGGPPQSTSHQPQPQPQHPPSQLHSPVDMDEDVDMDAPLISILREEVSPPPPTPSKKSSSKPMIHIKKRPPPPTTKVPKETDDGEDEEDQLIDDDDMNEEGAKPSPSTGGHADTQQKRKTSAGKKRPRKSEKKQEGDKSKEKSKEKIAQSTGAHTLAPEISSFEANPTEFHEDIESVHEPSASAPVDPGQSKGKKRTSPKKPPAIPRAKIKIPKPKTAIPPLLLDDIDAQSESYAGTAASSPINGTMERSPEPEAENAAPPESSPPVNPSALPEDVPNLEGVPIPVYPLPTKPFPVQPHPKIPTGFAPPMPLDKSRQKVRHWRPAQREIRGIAGGRWLTRTWVGDKESDYATHVANSLPPPKIDTEKIAAANATAKLAAGASISAPPATKTMGKLKASSKSGSVAGSSNPSRAPSVTPEGQPGIPITSTVRAPTKMRILQLPPTEDGGSGEPMDGISTPIEQAEG